ncbi:cryptochrome/photolyase family protein [Corynebacterium striatum]|nr:deoxyribodipyrimidine photo-lyase [Corynebacterium striatum]
MTTLHWFRDDLRLHDNPALTWAASRGEVIACVLDEPTYPGSRPSGSATSWWRERSLSCLAEELASYNVPLYRLNGDARTTIPAFAKSQNVSAVCWNRRYHLSTIDAVLKESLHSQGLEIHSFAAHTLVEPQAVKPYKVYSAFARAARAVLQNTLQPALEVPDLHGPGAVAWEEASAPAWAASLAKHWTPGEKAARKALAELDLSDYDKGRDFPARPATSRLSPHLRWGEVSAREVWQFASALPTDASSFHSELLWRDFAWHRLYHVPDLATEPVREKFRNFDWYWDDGGIDTSGKDPRPHPLPELQAWRTGETGIPLVDAGMRELWQTGYMHNRVRMVVGSFLTKNLGIHWRHGEEWFWDTLVDADPASNPFNWQWVAGCGDDASPFFRIFNPQLQASKFDPDGTYVRQWAPPLSPPPIVDLKESRQAALDAYQEIR